MKKWPILLVVLCLGLLGQDQRASSNRYVLHLIGHTAQLSLAHFGHYDNPLLSPGVLLSQRKAVDLTISAEEMAWDHDTGEIKLTGNVRLKIDLRSK
jgi:hypothetical protein